MADEAPTPPAGGDVVQGDKVVQAPAPPPNQPAPVEGQPVPPAPSAPSQ